MQLKLVGLKAAGLRCAEIDLNFGTDGTKQFTFIQMPNSTGKTTLAELLRAALSGEASGWDTARLRSLQRRNSATDNGLFEARFLLDGRNMAVGIKFDFIEQSCSYYTTLEPRGRKPGHDLPAPLMRFSSRDFVRLYVFDAELPQQLLEPRSPAALQAIDAFYQLYVFDQVSRGLDHYLARAVEESKASTTQGLTRAQNRLELLEERHDDLVRRHANWVALLAEIQFEALAMDDELEQHLVSIEAYRERKEASEAALAVGQEELDAGIAAAFGRLQEPLDAYPQARFALDGLAAALDSLRLPEVTSRQFFDDLVQRDLCICGRPMDSSAQAAILQSSKEVLQDESAGVINALKNDVRALQREDVCHSPARHAATLTTLLEARDRAATRLEQLRDDTSARADDRARELNEELIKLRRREVGLVETVRDMEREPHLNDDEDGSCLKWFADEIERAQKRVATISKTVTLRERTNLLKRTLSRAKEAAIAAAREELAEATSARLNSLLPGEDVRVSQIGPSIQLENRDGLNVGATLSVAYAFLTTLFERGNHRFPFVVDAPTMGLDGLARAALANLMPSVTDQFVGFVLDNERDFARAVQKTAPGHCEFYTIFSDTSRNKPLTDQLGGAAPAGGGTYVVGGFEFFDNVKWAEPSEDVTSA